MLVSPKLQLNANDDDFFQFNIVQRRSPVGGLRRLRDSEKKVWNCFEFFKKQVERKFASKRGEDVAKFINEVVTERLVFISVRVLDQLSAYTVLETLNARGIELTETDLLKNYLLSLADRLSKSQMDAVLRQWARITDYVGIARFPEFLRHHLDSQRDYVRQKQLFKTIKADVRDLKQVFGLLDALEKDGAWFEALNDPGSTFWLDYNGAKEHVRVLNLFGVSQYLPLILATKDRFRSHEIVEVLRYCAIISVRFNGIGHRSTHVLEEVYNKAAVSIRSGVADSLAKVRHQLKSIYIGDQEFLADFSSLRLKRNGLQGKRLRYILAKIEHQLSGLDVSDETMNATVEHILPENPGETGWDEFSNDARERSLERIGNYSLLERGLNNKEASNASFRDKKLVYDKSQYQTSRQLGDYNDWTEATIDARSKNLGKVAKSIWALEM